MRREGVEPIAALRPYAHARKHRISMHIRVIAARRLIRLVVQHAAWRVEPAISYSTAISACGNAPVYTYAFSVMSAH